MILIIELDEEELAHTLEALSGVVDVVEGRSDELVPAVILRGVMSKLIAAAGDTQ